LGNVKNLMSTDVARQLEYVSELYRAGQIRGILFQVLLTSDDAITSSGGQMSFIEKIGLLETAKQDLFYAVQEE
jgi:hypothetical protein